MTACTNTGLERSTITSSAILPVVVYYLQPSRNGILNILECTTGKCDKNAVLPLSAELLVRLFIFLSNACCHSTSFENHQWIPAFDMKDNLMKASDLVYKPYFATYIFNPKEADRTGGVWTYFSYIFGLHYYPPCQSHPFNAAIISDNHAVGYP